MTPSRALAMRGVSVLTFCPGLFEADRGRWEKVGGTEGSRIVQTACTETMGRTCTRRATGITYIAGIAPGSQEKEKRVASRKSCHVSPAIREVCWTCRSLQRVCAKSVRRLREPLPPTQYQQGRMCSSTLTRSLWLWGAGRDLQGARAARRSVVRRRLHSFDRDMLRLQPVPTCSNDLLRRGTF